MAPMVRGDRQSMLRLAMCVGTADLQPAPGLSLLSGQAMQAGTRLQADCSQAKGRRRQSKAAKQAERQI